MANALAEVVEADRRGSLTWSVGGPCFAWEREFSKADIRRFAEGPVPDGPILAVRVNVLGYEPAGEWRAVVRATWAATVRRPPLAASRVGLIRPFTAEGWRGRHTSLYRASATDNRVSTA